MNPFVAPKVAHKFGANQLDPSGRRVPASQRAIDAAVIDRDDLERGARLLEGDAGNGPTQRSGAI
jgi:hypothetical protein